MGHTAYLVIRKTDGSTLGVVHTRLDALDVEWLMRCRGKCGRGFVVQRIDCSCNFYHE